MSARRPAVEELQRRLDKLQRRLVEKEAELIELQMSVQATKEFSREPTTVNWKQI